MSTPATDQLIDGHAHFVTEAYMAAVWLKKPTCSSAMPSWPWEKPVAEATVIAPERNGHHARPPR